MVKMDCNKDEAIWAKEIAEEKLMEKDFAGAKKFALKAKKLYPELESLPQLMAILDVYIAAEIRVNRQLDWYKILGADFLDVIDVIGKLYKELVQKIHTGKNKPVGADGALKLISEAWSVLSDEDKRYDYDQKRNEKSRTFWTRCSTCESRLECLRHFVNKNILCTKCRQAFLAVEMRPLYTPDTSNKQQLDSNMQAIYEEALGMLKMGSVVPNENAPNGKSSMPTSHNGFHNSNGNNSNSRDQSSATHPQPAPSSQAGTFSKSDSTDANGTAAGSSASAGVGQPAYEQPKRGREEAPPAMRDEALRSKTSGAGFC